MLHINNRLHVQFEGMAHCNEPAENDHQILQSSIEHLLDLCFGFLARNCFSSLITALINLFSSSRQLS